MLGIAAAHVPGDVAPAAGPETGQVLGRLDWTPGRRRDREYKRDLAVRDSRMLRESEQRLRADFDAGARGGRVVDRVPAAGGADELRWRDAVETARRLISKEPFDG